MIGPLALFMAAGLTLAPQADEEKELNRYLTALKLEISTLKTTLDPIDVLQFTVRYTNISDAPLKLDLESRLLPGGAMVYLADPEGRAWWPHGLKIKGEYMPIRLRLNPGEYCRFQGTYSLCLMQRIGTSSDSMSTPQTGSWKVWAEYGRPASIIKSNVTTFQVQRNERMPARVRAEFEREPWHRFAAGGEIGKSDLNRFRDYVLSGVEEGQRDLMAVKVGFRHLSDTRLPQAVEMLKAAQDSRLGNLDKTDLAIWNAYAHFRNGKREESLALLRKVEMDPKDVTMKEIRELILKAGQ